MDGHGPVDTVFLEGMLFFGRHGVFPAEKEKGGRFTVDLRLTVDLARAGETDALAETIDYEKIYTLVRDIVEGPPKNLLEAVARDIVEACFRFDPRVAAAECTVRKLDPPFPGALSAVGVTVRRLRPQEARPH
ncbi:dihydroneopterin aldolase [Hydrogenibacillus sp. N12]|uniref:dihydroneopterin aldolase n=1 Tax=Hydrogenibacillus sp. N12 TaxID=2866627 RepID=UPI00207BEC14|nr:dihydroneopterin aldolase [Hydrogenibacillus sp. N12]